MANRSPDGTNGKSEGISALKDKTIAKAGGLAASMVSSADSFVKHAGISDLYEIQAGEIALRRSKSQGVRDLARHMIDDHRQASGLLKQTAARFDEIPDPPSELDTSHKALIKDLEGAKDQDFDKRYVAQQQDAHKNAISMFEHYRDKGDNHTLRQFADDTLPTLRRHMQMVKDLDRSP